MTIRFTDTDLFDHDVEALVNTVNCVGVMGKGVALHFKNKWPENYSTYKRACDKKLVKTGEMLVFPIQNLFSDSALKLIVNFPTKQHWRAKSKIEYIETGLDDLARVIRRNGIRSIALPALGCGNGGLNWDDVRPIIEQKLKHIDGVDIIVSAPTPPQKNVEIINTDESAEFNDDSFPMTAPRAVLLKALSEFEIFFNGCFDRISLQKIVYFLQASGVNYRLDFNRNLHGPYSEQLRKSFIALEKAKMISGFTSAERETKVTSLGYAKADDFLKHLPSNYSENIERVNHLIQGYESPFGLELLSTVHWLAVKEKVHPLEKVIKEFLSWGDNKRNTYSESDIIRAYKRLEEDGFLARNS